MTAILKHGRPQNWIIYIYKYIYIYIHTYLHVHTIFITKFHMNKHVLNFIKINIESYQLLSSLIWFQAMVHILHSLWIIYSILIWIIWWDSIKYIAKSMYLTLFVEAMKYFIVVSVILIDCNSLSNPFEVILSQ